MRLRWIAAALAGLWVLAIGGAAALDETALWSVVKGLCVFDQTHFRTPAPCAKVYLKDGEERGWAVVKDLTNRTHFLLVPTRRLSGVEDPLIGGDELPNYWIPAWATRKLLADSAQAELAFDQVGMAINGPGSRSQDQLHIHVDCVRPDVRRELQKKSGAIGEAWGSLQLSGRAYRARRIYGEEPDPDPFRLLAQDKASLPLRENSLAVIGALFPDGRRGFILLAEKAPGGAAHTEDLLDHKCRIAAR